MSKKINILLWGVAPDQDLSATLDFIHQNFPNNYTSLVILKSRKEPFLNKVNQILETSRDIAPNDWTLLIKILLLKTDIHIIPCGSDYNLFYAVEPLLNRIGFFKKRTLIGLLKNKTFIRIPIECQLLRSYLKYPFFAFLISFFLSKTLFLALATLSSVIILFALVDYLFLCYLKKFRRSEYIHYLMFKREEFPYVSHGWMHPFDEGYFNRLIFSKEGLSAQFYEVDKNYFPIYNPSILKPRLRDRFDFVNTHEADLDKPAERVFVLGGSVAQGLLSDPNSYHRILERELNEHLDNKLEVIPWAIGGYQSTQSRILAECSLLDRKPKAILSLDFFNDVLYTILAVPPGDTQRSQKKFLEKYSAEYKLLSCLFDYSVFARFIWQKRYAALMNEYIQSLLNDPIALNRAINHCISIYLENTCRIHEMCLQKDIWHLAFIQPFRDYSAQIEQSRDSNPKSILTNQFYDHLSKWLANDVKMSQFILCFPQKIFTPDDFFDEVHFNNNGQKKIALHMTEHFLNLIPREQNV